MSSVDRGAPNVSESGPDHAVPRKWKSILVTFLVVFPTVELLTRVAVPLLGPLPGLLRDVLMVGTMSIALSFVLPMVNQRVRGWLVR